MRSTDGRKRNKIQATARRNGQTNRLGARLGSSRRRIYIRLLQEGLKKMKIDKQNLIIDILKEAFGLDIDQVPRLGG